MIRINEIKLSVGYTVKIRLARLAEEEEATRLKQTKKYEEVPDRIVSLVVQTLEIKDPDGELLRFRRGHRQPRHDGRGGPPR